MINDNQKSQNNLTIIDLISEYRMGHFGGAVLD